MAYGDPVAGLYGAAAALVGLYGRERLGGVDIDLCQVECLFQVGSAGLIAEHARGRALSAERQSPRRRWRPAAWSAAPADGEAWLTVAVDSDAAWRGACRGHRPARTWPTIRRWPASPAARRARTRSRRRSRAWAASREPRDAAATLQAAGVPAAPVIPTHELFPDPHLQDCGYWALQFRAYIDDHFTPAAAVPLRRRTPAGGAPRPDHRRTHRRGAGRTGDRAE